MEEISFMMNPFYVYESYRKLPQKCCKDILQDRWLVVDHKEDCVSCCDFTINAVYSRWRTSQMISRKKTLNFFVSAVTGFTHYTMCRK